MVCQEPEFGHNSLNRALMVATEGAEDLDLYVANSWQAGKPGQVSVRGLRPKRRPTGQFHFGTLACWGVKDAVCLCFWCLASGSGSTFVLELLFQGPDSREAPGRTNGGGMGLGYFKHVIALRGDMSQ